MGNLRNIIINKQITWIKLLNYCFLLLGILTIYNAQYGSESINISIEYAEEYNEKDIAQIFYADSEFHMNEEMSYKGSGNAKTSTISISMDLSLSEYQTNVLRLDPINKSGKCTIKRIIVSDNYRQLFSISGENFAKYIKTSGDIEVNINNDKLILYCLTDDPRCVLNSMLNQEIIDSALQSNLIVFYIVLVLYILFGVLQIVLTRKNKIYKSKKICLLQIIGTCIIVAIGGIFIYGEQYLTDNFDDVPLGQLLYHLHTPLNGTSTQSLTSFFVSIILIVFVSIFVILLLYWLLGRLNKRDTFLNWISVAGGMATSFAIMLVCFHFDVSGYLKYVNEYTTIYEENYVDGREVDITFPNQKRNLIFIFLESMETTYANIESGGAMDIDCFNELTDISMNNESFGNDGIINGAYTVMGTTFTMGGLVAQTSGIPINENIVSNDTLNSEWQSENNYVPGVYAIGDVLKEHGYNQEFLIGSDGKFAGRSSYFMGHGEYKIFDYYTAIEKKYIDEDYKVWWGYEDQKLFEIAKDEILELAKAKEPFNFTLLTVDTHFTDGYLCEQCEDIYNEQYSNVIQCSSRQVSEFVKWIKEQPFYYNTTVVISGDHLTMDSGYIERNVDLNYNRRTYFTIINGDAINEKTGANREYTTLDIYPTTLAALGVKIQGNRLGLGTNLYSKELTLLEKYGQEYLDIELLKDSKFYRKKFSMQSNSIYKNINILDIIIE